MNKPWPPPAPDASRHFRQAAEAGLKEPPRAAIVSPVVWNSQREDQGKGVEPPGMRKEAIVNLAKRERIERMERRSLSWPPPAPALAKDFKLAVEAKKEVSRAASSQGGAKSQNAALEQQNKRTAPQLNLNPPGMRRPLIINRAQRERIEKMEQRSPSWPPPAPAMSRSFQQAAAMRQKEIPRLVSPQRTDNQQDKRPTLTPNLNQPVMRKNAGENLAKRERIQKMEQRLMKDKARKDFGRSAGREL